MTFKTVSHRGSLFRYFLRLCAVAFIVPHLFCGGVAGIVSSATSGGSATSTGTADALSGTESQLYEDGPIELPVTIAKLDSPDLSLITVTVEEISSTTANATKFAATSTHIFTVTGLAGAGGRLSDDSFAPKFFMFNATTDEQAVSEVGADGSFTGQIDGELSDTIAFASMTEGEDQVSPILSVAVDDNGNFIVATTNASDLSADVNVMTDPDGNYYFTVVADDGTFTLLRRNLGGTEVETIATGLNSEPRVILAGSGPAVTVILQDGSIVVFAQPPPSLTGFVAGRRALFAEGDSAWTSATVETIQGGVNTSEQTAWPGHSLLYSATERTLALTSPSAQPGGIGASEDLLRFVDLSGGGVTATVIATGEFDAIYADTGESGKIYVFANWPGGQEGEGTATLFRFDFQDLDVTPDPSLAWQARETLVSGFEGRVNSLDVSDEGAAVFQFITADNNNNRGIAYWSASSGVVIINDMEGDPRQYAYPKISPDGKFVIFCDVGEGDQLNVPGNLTVYFPGDGAGDFHPLVESGTVTTCADNPSRYFIDSQDRIHFYQAPVGGVSQLGVIDPRNHSVFEGLDLPALE